MARPHRDVMRLHAALRHRFRESTDVTTLRPGQQSVLLDLRAGATALARELVDQYGNAVQTTLAGRPFPPTPITFPAFAPAGPQPTRHEPDLRLRTCLDRPSVVSGNHVTGTLRLSNDGQNVIVLDTDQPLTAAVLGADGRLAGFFSGARTGTGRIVRLDPGQAATLPCLGGTTGTLTYCTPPGSYTVVVEVPVHAPQHRGRPQLLVSDPTPLHVVPQPDA